MSESSDELTAFSRRQPLNRRQRPQKVQKVAPKKVKANNQQQVVAGKTALARPKNQIASGQIPATTRRVKSELVMPTAVKPIPTAKVKIPPSQSGVATVKTVRMEKPKIGRRSSRKTRLKPMAKTILYILRLLIVGVGMGAIVGTALSVLDPANRITTNSAPQSGNSNVTRSQAQPTPTPPAAPSTLLLSQEILPLKNAVQNLASNNQSLTPGVFLVDLDTGNYVDINASTTFPAASTIKIPILIAFFEDVDRGKIRLDEMLTMQQDMIAGGSGNMQYQAAGTQYAALEVATKMITISDNTATNMLITRLGGIDALNQRFRSWGLTTTVIRNQLPDLQGTNTTSPKELGNLMAIISQGNLISMPSRDLMLDILRRTQRDSLLPSGLGTGARVYHKTGDIGTMLADTGLIVVPTGKRYVAAVMVKRPNNDPRAEKLISSISRAAYQEFSQNPVTPSSGISTVPTNGYQPQIVNPVLPNTATSTVPMTGYQAPFINPVPNGMGNTLPTNNYQTPITNPQYYPPR
ncbi:MAG: serine hydrolase [Nostoc sp. ZfuVER08]|uniref:Serine hydrolase n=1 Tax=Nostoc punctiforme FACHB-252 TaxID=1357509 RepID=A0ABR8H9H5_NOSPU|nr:serine hydrolase [Nostoc punctiforme]MBD2612393.1 serine hydrolase [Nostoc punctiforme FACHB-252]MBL1198831.1 serine hydrolase [Nostoc sp. GBBB01]MDZ8013197.1 serine hydrolase [Nostoc sp. ZfuVER08]